MYEPRRPSGKLTGKAPDWLLADRRKAVEKAQADLFYATEAWLEAKQSRAPFKPGDIVEAVIYGQWEKHGHMKCIVTSVQANYHNDGYSYTVNLPGSNDNLIAHDLREIETQMKEELKGAINGNS